MNDIVTEQYQYPCNRGVPGNTTSRGWHNFTAVPGGVPTCTYCGAQPATAPVRWQLPAPVTGDVTYQPGGGAVETTR